MIFYLYFAQILLAVILIITILMQIRGAGAGLFGAAPTSYRSRRGLEKTLFQLTIVLAVLFIAIAILILMLN